MIQHTLDRFQQEIPAERILIVVTSHHRPEVEKELAHWPQKNIIYQPRNRDTAPGILLPLAHITHSDPSATVVVSPSDHFVLDDERFMASVRTAVRDLEQHPKELVLLGMTPEQGQETEYGYIEVGNMQQFARTLPVTGFREKPQLNLARRLIGQGARWNTMVFTVRSSVLWDMVKQTTPVLYNSFSLLQTMLSSVHAPRFVEHIYDSLPNVNFSSEICQPLAQKLRVLPVPDVGWSDWGTVTSIFQSLRRMGKLDAFRQRLDECQVHPSWYAIPVPASVSEAFDAELPLFRNGTDHRMYSE